LALSYRITRDKDVDTSIITFHAGPPYEDIAFRSKLCHTPATFGRIYLLFRVLNRSNRIVNREWEKSHRKGFKCTFERGIMYALSILMISQRAASMPLSHPFRMHLWVQFKKFKYKR
jgi:hypothetical protein